MMPLNALLARLEKTGLLLETQGRFDTNECIDHLAHDSRKVGPHGLFVAITGEKADGHLFIDKAVNNEAIAVVCKVIPEGVLQHVPGVAFARVRDTRAALAELAAAFYGDPSRDLTLIGITGTNGKTTTAYLVHHLLTTVSGPAGLIGTIEYLLGGVSIPATHTTPDALDLNRILRQMIDAGCSTCTMEVSSHALSQHRVRAVAFDVGVFTNLTREHLDFHHTVEDYLRAKKSLFDDLPAEATALYNRDDPAGSKIVADTAVRRISYGQSDDADLHLTVIENTLRGLQLRLNDNARAFRLVGRFNAYNVAAAYGVGIALGYDPDVVLDALAEAPPVPGRFEQFAFADGTTVIVDYAHTPDALENVLKAILETRKDGAALWCLFGCGGDRDPSKRVMMGAIAERYADHIIVTADNTRTEPLKYILRHIRSGMEHPKEACWIDDRDEAIAAAAHHAAPGDVVLIAGKGHEPYQIIGEERFHFDDREKVKLHFGPRGLITM